MTLVLATLPVLAVALSPSLHAPLWAQDPPTQPPAESALESTETPVQRADSLWRNRAEGSAGGRAAAEPIASIVEIYGQALQEEPGDLVLRGKLLRALFFQGEYVPTEGDARLALYTRAQQLGEQGLDQLADQVGGRKALDGLSPSEVGSRLASVPGAADVYYWTGVHWGLWGRHRGPIAAARQGVASKIRDYAERTIALAPKAENAGGHRLLGQLHSEAPKIPIFTGWIDRESSIRELQTAHDLFPDDLLSQFYLAQALVKHSDDERERGMKMLRSVIASTPNPGWKVEEEDVILDAREFLASLDN